MEKFNPTDPSYRAIEDLPYEHQDKYVPYENGFVRKEAIEAWGFWEKEAKEKNENRFVLKRVFNLDFHDAMQLAMEEARVEDIERTRSEENRKAREWLKQEAWKEIRELDKKLSNALELALIPQIESIQAHQFDVVISEDRAGRLPAEIFLKTINKIYAENQQDLATLVPILLSRARGKDANHEAVRDTVEALIHTNQLKSGLLYVSDMMSTGKSFYNAFSGISDVIKSPSPFTKDGKYLVGVSIMYNNRGRHYGFEEIETPPRPYFTVVGAKGTSDGRAEMDLKKWSGLYTDADYSLNRGERLAREEFIEKKSDDLVKRYKEILEYRASRAKKVA